MLVAGVYVAAQLAGKLVNLAKYAPLNIVQNSLAVPRQVCTSGPVPCPLPAWAQPGSAC